MFRSHLRREVQVLPSSLLLQLFTSRRDDFQEDMLLIDPEAGKSSSFFSSCFHEISLFM